MQALGFVDGIHHNNGDDQTKHGVAAALAALTAEGIRTKGETREPGTKYILGSTATAVSGSVGQTIGTGVAGGCASNPQSQSAS